MSRIRAWPICCLAAALLLITFAKQEPLAAQPAAPAAKYGLVFLKDGFVIRGYIKQEGHVELDRTGGTPQLEWIANGFCYIDDGARRIIFPPSIQAIDVRKPDNSNNIVWQYPGIYSPNPLPPILGGIKTTRWGEVYDIKKVAVGVRRTITYTTIQKNSVQETRPIGQHLAVLTPDYARADSTNQYYNWGAHYLTSELGPDQVRTIFGLHKATKITDGMKPKEVLDRRFQMFHFLAAADWLDEAKEDLDSIEKDYPKEKEKVKDARKKLKSLQALQLYDRLKRAHGAGRFEWFQKYVGGFPDSGLPERMHDEIRTLQEDYEAATDALKKARHYLEVLPKALDDKDVHKEFLTEAAAAIRSELHLDHFLKDKGDPRGKDKDAERFSRLERFLSQAKQVDRQKEAKEKPDAEPRQLLALAITGWLLGDRSAETKPETAKKLWEARQLLIDCNKTTRVSARDKLITAYEKKQTTKDGIVSVDEFIQMIPFLPPPEPPAEIDYSPMELKAKEALGGKVKKYWAQVPPEYRPGRSYPVLIVLHQSGEKARQMLDRWKMEAARNGYILAAVQWSDSEDATYAYSEEEHAIVLDLLHDLKRKFNVDSDRVFLAGFGQGGNMAYDIGLSHPDEFAGILPMCGMPGYWGDRYASNAQYLPFYISAGDQSGNIHLKNRDRIRDWIGRNFPAMYVEYKGRGLEWFAGEVPIAFDWMNRKSRAYPVSEVGNARLAFQTMRQADNHFYWVSTNRISSKSVMPSHWNPNVYAASIHAQILPGNHVYVTTRGVEQVTVWFGRVSKLEADKPVEVTVASNGGIGRKYTNVNVKPKLSTLVNDFSERGDRQRLFLARFDVDLTR
jgi:predicted esterase